MIPEQKGYKQLRQIIRTIMDKQTYPNWDFVNGVLSCKDILGEDELWFHWGKLLIIPKEKNHSGTIASECEMLDEWILRENGTIKLVGKKWGDEDD